SARNGVFNLQGLARLYEDTDSQFEKARKRFKALEDGIGGFAKWDELLEKAEKKSSDIDVIAKLKSKRSKARKDLEKLLVEEKFIRETKTEATYLKTFRAFLLNRDWNTVAEDREIMLGKLSGQLQTIKSSTYDFTKLEEGNGIHEFRRKIRWFAMEARALNGLLILKPLTTVCPIEAYKDLPSSEWAKSKYGVLPPSQSETAPVAVTACLYVKMAKAIDDVGKIKDAVEEVDNNTAGDASDAASLDDQVAVNAIYNEMMKSRVFDLLTFQTRLGGETAELYNEIDWASTSLGPYSGWPEPLKYLVNSMLGCPIPMYICWGEDRIFLYNDAYRVLLSKKHPAALGQKFDVVWPEVWPQLQDLFKSVASGNNYYIADMKMELERHGYPEECYFTFSFNPIADGKGKAIGLQCICYETTAKILNDRSINALQISTDAARIKAENATVELENFFKQAPVAIALLEGFEHRFTLANELYYKFVGVRSIIGRTVREVFPDLVGQPFFGLLDDVYRTGVPFMASDAPITFETIDGEKETSYVDFIYAPRFGLDNKVEGITATIVDVTAKYRARKVVEDQLEEMKALTSQLTDAQSDLDEEKRKFEIIFENAASGMAMVKEPQHIFEKANPSFREMLGNR
ncbi:MAG: PAS domain-containing protein, partial [Proteobacteria bacterium]